MKLKRINNLYEYEEAKKYINSLFHSELTEEQSNEIEILSVLMEDFERKGEPVREDISLEPLIDYVYDLVSKASKFEKNGLIEKGLKLGEEYGELSAEILKYTEYKRTTENKDSIKENILLESTDCLIMIFDIMSNMGFTKEQICDMAEKQVNKWITNITIE